MPLEAFEAGILGVAVLAYLLSFAGAAFELAARKRGEPHAARSRWGSAARWALLLALVVHGVLVVERAVRLGDGSLADAPATLLFVTWCAALVATIIDWSQDVRVLPLFVVPPVVTALTLGAAFLRRLDGPVSFEEPGRVALWIHVGTAIVAYAAFGFSAVLAVMYLFLEGQLKRKRLGVWLELPPLDRLEQAARRFVTSGFVLLTLSLVVGVVFQAATGVLGSSWLSSPKTVATLATWLASGALVLLSRRTLVAGRRQVMATLLVCGLVLLTYLGMPLLGGEHLPAALARSR